MIGEDVIVIDDEITAQNQALPWTSWVCLGEYCCVCFWVKKK